MPKIKTYIFIFLYFITGILSTWIFHRDDEEMFINGCYPGILFILTTLICVFLSKIDVQFWPTFKFVLIAYFSYLIIFFVTLLTSVFAFAVGIVTGGIGSLIIFYLFKKYIKRISYNKMIVFGLGAIAFTANDLILMTPLREIAPDFFRKDMTGEFSAIFFIWQFIIGARLAKDLN